MAQDSILLLVHLRCVTLAQQTSDFRIGGESYQTQAWEWLNQNDIGPVSAAKGTR